MDLDEETLKAQDEMKSDKTAFSDNSEDSDFEDKKTEKVDEKSEEKN